MEAIKELHEIAQEIIDGQPKENPQDVSNKDLCSQLRHIKRLIVGCMCGDNPTTYSIDNLDRLSFMAILEAPERIEKLEKKIEFMDASIDFFLYPPSSRVHRRGGT